MYKQTDTYRKQVRDEDYFLNLRKEVAALDQPNRVFDFRVLTSEGDTADEMADLWEKKAEADGFLLEKHSRSLCFRPCSPDFIPSDAPGNTDKRDMPQQPLTSTPNYPNELHIVPLGPTAQFAIYASSADKEERSRNYIRVGQPGYLQEYRERASKLGSSCLSYFNSLFGRLHIVQHLALKEKIRWTNPDEAHLINGLNSVVECFNPASPHFRSDLLSVFLGNHSRAGDSAIGFIGLIATHGGTRRFWEDGVRKEMPTTRRVFDILYSISEFRKIFTTFFERETVRRMLGASRYDLPSTACLMTMEDWFFVTQRLVILPKNPRRLFVLEFYQNGVCIGVVALVGTEHRLKLLPGEYALTESDYGLVPATKRIKAGPAAARTKEVAAQDQVPTKVSLKEHQAQHVSAVKLAQQVAEREEEIQAEEDSLRRAFAVKPDTLTGEEKRLLYEFYQTKLDEEIYTRIVEDTEFLTQIRQVSAWAKEAASEIDARRSNPGNPLLTTLTSNDQVKQEQSRRYHQAVVDFQDRVFEGQPRFKTNLASLQKKMNAMSLVPSYSCVDQFWTILRKNCEDIMGCTNCRGRHGILARRCPCLRIFLERREEHRQEAVEEGERPCWDERFVACFRCRVYNEELGRQELPEDYLIDQDTRLCDCMEAWVEILEIENHVPAYCRVCATVQPCDCRPHIPRPAWQLRPDSKDNYSTAGQPDFQPDQLVSGNMEGLRASQRGGSLIQGSSQLQHQPGVGPELPDAEIQALAEEKQLEADALDPPSLDMDDPRVVFTASHYKEGSQSSSESSETESTTESCETDSQSETGSAFQSSQSATHGVKPAKEELVQNSPLTKPFKEFKFKSLAELTGSDKVDGRHLVTAMALSDVEDIPSAARAQVTKNKEVEKERYVWGYAALPSYIVPFDSRTAGAYPTNGVPSHYQGDKAESKITRSQSFALYSSPLVRGPVNMMNNSAVSKRYLRTRKGRKYNPVDTLYTLVKDAAQPVEHVPLESMDITQAQLELPTGSKISNECRDSAYICPKTGKVKRGDKVAIRITSMHIMEPTTVPLDAPRTWLSKLMSADAHGSSLIEFIGTVVGHLSFLARSWVEFLDEHNARVLRTTVPGRSVSDYSYSVGSSREDVPHWPLKLSGRTIVCLMTGCCTRMSLAEAAKQSVPLSEAPYLAALDLQKSARRFVPDKSLGAPKNSMMLDPSMDPGTTVGLWRLARDSEGKELFWEKIVWQGFQMEFTEVGMAKSFGQSIRVTNGRTMPAENLLALQGIASFIVTHFDELSSRYIDFCNSQRPRIDPRDKAFQGNRFPRGLMTPAWFECEGLVQRVFGRNWSRDLENMIFRLENDDKLYWLSSSKNGPLAKEFLESNYDANIEESEIIARIAPDGTFTRMSEEKMYQAGAGQQEEPLLDGGHRMARKTRSRRHKKTTKNYSTAEFADCETC